MDVCYPFQLDTCHAQWWEIHHFLRNSLWTEAANITMLLENNLITPNSNMSSFQQFFRQKNGSILSSVQKFGEMCIITFKGQHILG